MRMAQPLKHPQSESAPPPPHKFTGHMRKSNVFRFRTSLLGIPWRRRETKDIKYDRRLADGNVHCDGSATYQIFLKYFYVIDPEPQPRTLTLNPKP